MSNTDMLVESILANDFEAAETLMNTIMRAKVREAIEVERVKIANKIFNK